MKMQKLTVIFTSFILLIAAGAAAEETKAISNTRNASCLVKITADPSLINLDFDTVDFLLHSSSVYDKAAREVLVMRYIQQQSYDDIARQTGKTSHQVRAMCSRSIRHLRDILGSNHRQSATKEINNVHNR